MLSTAVLTVAATKGLPFGLENSLLRTASAKADVKIVFSLFVNLLRNTSSSRLNDLRKRVQRSQERFCWDCVFLVVALPLAASPAAIREMILSLLESEIF